MNKFAHSKADRLGWVLQHQTAELITMTLAHIDTELRHLSAYPTAGGDQLGVSGGGPSVMVEEDDNGPAERTPVTSIEAVVMRADGLREISAQLRDRLEGIEIAIYDLNRLMRSTLGSRVPRTIPDLCDGRAKGFAGHMLAWTPHSRDTDNGWYDPSCRDAAGATGLCDTCLIRMNRWRERNNMPRIASDGRSEVVGAATHAA